MLQQNQDGTITGIGSEFEWGRRELLTDLVRLWSLGVRGTIIILWFKFQLTANGVEEYHGEVRYPETPDGIYTREEDVS